MRPNKEIIYYSLLVCQQRFGGYTGKDFADIGRNLGFDIKTITFIAARKRHNQFGKYT
jgi:hypothetical protein